MAVVSELGELWDTSNNTAHTVTATPAVDDLIVVIHGMSGWASGDTSVITDNQSGTYTQIGANPLSTAGGTGGALWISIRTALIPSAVSTIFTETPAGSTGSGLTVLKVTGMTRTGADAALQNIGESTQTENPPVIAFPVATLAGNPIILGVFGEDNPPALTPPTGFTETTDAGWATPTSGIEIVFNGDGNTLSSYSWSAGALTDHNEVGVELDTSAAPTGHPVARRWGGIPHMAGQVGHHGGGW